MLEITRENLKLKKLCLHFLLVASLLVLPGCFITEINPDGSGVLTRLIVAPVGVPTQTFCPQAGRGYATRIEGRNCYATASFKNLSELRELIEAVKSPAVRINQLERTGGKFIVDLSVEAPEWSPEYLDHIYFWSLKMPGQTTSHNAHRIQGDGALMWIVNPDNGVFRVHAESQVN